MAKRWRSIQDGHKWQSNQEWRCIGADTVTTNSMFYKNYRGDIFTKKGQCLVLKKDFSMSVSQQPKMKLKRIINLKNQIFTQ